MHNAKEYLGLDCNLPIIIFYLNEEEEEKKTCRTKTCSPHANIGERETLFAL